jgi:hypothetical protein
MGPSKGSSGKGRVSDARVGKTHKDDGPGAGKGSGEHEARLRDRTARSSGGGTLKYRSGDVKRSTGSFSKYGK